MKQITLEELRSVQYFHEHKGDITRMCDWPQVLAKIKSRTCVCGRRGQTDRRLPCAWPQGTTAF